MNKALLTVSDLSVYFGTEAALKNVSATLFYYAHTSFVVGGISCSIGIILASLTNLPVGSMIILSSSFLFICSLFFKTNTI